MDVGDDGYSVPPPPRDVLHLKAPAVSALHQVIIDAILRANITDRWQLTLRRLMSYVYGAPIFDVSRSHAATQHSR